MAEGWGRLPDAAPTMARVVLPLLRDPRPLVAALARVPHTLVHGDWKAANLGSHPGREDGAPRLRRGARRGLTRR